MIVSLISKNNIWKFELPVQPYGNYWITNRNNQNVINAEAINGKWIIKSNNEYKIYQNGVIVEQTVLENHSFYYVKKNSENEYTILYSAPMYDTDTIQLQLKANANFLIGSDPSCQIIYKNELTAPKHAQLVYQNGRWIIQNLDPSRTTYVNDVAISTYILNYGDIICIMGLKIVVIANFILINNPGNRMSYNQHFFTPRSNPVYNILDTNDEDEEQVIDFYKEEEYFLRSPRFRSNIEEITFVIDPPPAAQSQQEMPLLFTMGPMLTMGMTSLITAGVTLNNVLNGNQTLSSAAPSLMISGAMMCSMILWPTLTRSWQKKQKKKREKIRQTKYGKYIEEKQKEIQTTMKQQRQILIENNVSLDECYSIIRNRKTTLWEKRIEEDDFLSVYLGNGSLPPQIQIKAPEEHFELEEDNLKELVKKVVNESKIIEDVPICLSLAKKNIVAIVGDNNITQIFLSGILLQLITFHSYEDLKLIIFTNKEREKYWKFAKILPHCWSNDKQNRFYATSADDMKKISSYLENEFYIRKEHAKQDKENQIQSPYYFIITDDIKVARNIDIIKNVLESDINLGFSILIKNDRLSNLPNECSTFINVGENSSGLFENELIANKQKEFRANLNTNINLQECAFYLSNIPIDIARESRSLPDTVGFLEMYNVGKIEQLNPLNRWKVNAPTISLSVPVGIDQSGEIFKLDLHEKMHGPHGLIAGMTGSGKSEFIITFILSMAINFHPNEVSFILIDYKGGGLAGAFKNNETGIKLPHLAGTITNLDTVEMNRSLSSIQSELKRRQAIFNQARDSLNESTVDIYKYQRFYRDGLVDKPISHLFIICDEFAELKSQQSDFMAQLISTARIGRSLGVHLILATQKPSGVVDDQIWSNSKFKVCLKVQDKSDSMDMIKVPDAAMLKQTGRFYLQVGYNEFFALGQSAWAGAQYIPSDKPRKKIDNSVNFVDNTGYIIKSIDDSKKASMLESKGEELPNIVRYLSDIAEANNIEIEPLWLDRIPDEVFVEGLKNKYKYQEVAYNLNPIIGEYDDPNNQRQGLLTLPLSKDGNTIIYGSTGSGKELFLTTTIYSLITAHSPKEVNIYCLDFGAETLKSFSHAPHVGDVLLLDDTEKITNLFKTLKSEMASRKKLFLEYGGNYNSYIQSSNSPLPSIVVLLNNYEVFSETYDQFAEDLIQITRDCVKYGIYFILSVGSINSIRYRLKQNFKMELCLQLNDDSDYSSIFSGIRGRKPSKIFGRGLVQLDNVYEFQTAYCFKKDVMSESIKQLSLNLEQQAPAFAPAIPVLPEKVNIESVSMYVKNNLNLPIGINKETLNVELFDFKTRMASLVLSNSTDELKPFVVALAKQITTLTQQVTIIIDPERLLEDNKVDKVAYYNDNMDETFTKILNYIEQQNEMYLANNYNRAVLNKFQNMTCIVIGINSFKQKLSRDNQSKFDTLFEKGKDLGTIQIIITDMASNVSKVEYDSWYKTVVAPNRGIWVGSGIANQMTLKIAQTTREMREELAPSFGYLVKNGKATLVKLIETPELPYISDGDDSNE